MDYLINLYIVTQAQISNAILLEFKVFNQRRESHLEETVQAALRQIEEKQYAAQLTAHGIPAERIRSYGFAFEGKRVLPSCNFPQNPLYGATLSTMSSTTN